MNTGPDPSPVLTDPHGGAYAFFTPRDLPGPSGGLIYNRRILQAWWAQGLEVVYERLAGGWPHPDRYAHKALRRGMSRYRAVLVDGIIASAAPRQVASASAAGVDITVLMHLPRPAETGLSPTEQQAAARAEQHALRSATRVVCTSDWARRDVMARYGVAAEVAPPGCDSAPVAHGSTPPRLLFLGAISPRKNPLLLLQALQPLNRHDWTLTIAGPSGADHQYVQAVAEEARGWGARVTLTGPLSGDTLGRVWAGTDLLVLPSRAETYGMVVTEALAHAIPALVGAGTGAEEALSAAHTPGAPSAATALPGEAADPTDRGAWTAVLQRWLEQDALRRRWRSNAAEHRGRLRTWTDAAQDLRAALRW